MREIVLDEIQAVLLRGDDDWRLTESVELHEGVEFAEEPEAPLYRADEGLWVEIEPAGFDSRIVAPLSSIVALRLHPEIPVKLPRRFPGAR